jgi:hypothetical protein
LTISDLKAALEQRGVNPLRYDLHGGIPVRSEGLVLCHENERWLVRHFERGSWYALGEYSTEADACEALLAYASDPFYRS